MQLPSTPCDDSSHRLNMKPNTVIASLFFSAVLAQDAQVPLKEKAAGWFGKAKSYVSSATPAHSNPTDAAASAVAAMQVQEINIKNYGRTLQPKPEGEEEWLVYLTGGNKTCFGRCGKTDSAWNVRMTLLLHAVYSSPVLLVEKNTSMLTRIARNPSCFSLPFPNQLAVPLYTWAKSTVKKNPFSAAHGPPPAPASSTSFFQPPAPRAHPHPFASSS